MHSYCFHLFFNDLCTHKVMTYSTAVTSKISIHQVMSYYDKFRMKKVTRVIKEEIFNLHRWLCVWCEGGVTPLWFQMQLCPPGYRVLLLNPPGL